MKEGQPNYFVEATAEPQPLIGREEYPLAIEPSSENMSLLDKFRKRSNEYNAKLISSKMLNNSAASSIALLGGERPRSAYFTELDGQLIVEWGEIDPKGQGKLHDYLNRNVDYLKRVKEGGKVRSGHLGLLKLPNTGVTTQVALIDSLAGSDTVTTVSPEYNIVMTLINNGIMPVSSDGFPVKITPDTRSAVRQTPKALIGAGFYTDVAAK